MSFTLRVKIRTINSAAVHLCHPVPRLPDRPLIAVDVVVLVDAVEGEDAQDEVVAEGEAMEEGEGRGTDWPSDLDAPGVALASR